MDSERQPLLNRTCDVRCRRSRPLTVEEVLSARQEIVWRRARFCMIFMFWAIMAMFLSIVTCLLITSKCGSFDDGIGLMPSVPPVHMTFTPLIASGRGIKYDDHVYAL